MTKEKLAVRDDLIKVCLEAAKKYAALNLPYDTKVTSTKTMVTLRNGDGEPIYEIAVSGRRLT